MKPRSDKKKKKSKSVPLPARRTERGKLNASPVKVEARKTLEKRGYAREGDLVATVEPAVFGRDGRNVLGETIPAAKVAVPRLVAGIHIAVEKGTQYYMRTTGVVEVSRDAEGNSYIKGKAYRRGSCNVVLSDDRMSALLSIDAAVGDASQVSVQDVYTELQSQGISFGIDRQAIEAAVEKVEETGESVDGIVIARGEEPVYGEDAALEFRVMRASSSSVKVRGDGRADFKDLDRITSVSADQLVAFMKRETHGREEGHTVSGESVPPQDGRSIDFELGDNIRVEDKGKVVEYYAQINGELILDGNRMSVEPVLVIEGDVGPKTGNIRFSGIVNVQGNVKDTFKIVANKDIIVEGNVGNAVIQTDGNLEVNGGIVGKGKGLVAVGGEVKVKFAENANIQAGQDIVIQRAALNCNLVSGARIISLQQKGQIIGGELRAREGVEVKILGNESENRMEVFVGSDFSLQSRLEDIQSKIQKYDSALKKILLVLGKLKKVNPDPAGLPDNLKKLYQDARKKGTVAKIALDELRSKEAAIEAKLEEVHQAEVIVRETLHRGVKVHFGKSVYEPETGEYNVKVTYNDKKGGVKLERLV